jgi:hypothetical protein
VSAGLRSLLYRPRIPGSTSTNRPVRTNVGVISWENCLSARVHGLLEVPSHNRGYHRLCYLGDAATLK